MGLSKTCQNYDVFILILTTYKVKIVKVKSEILIFGQCPLYPCKCEFVYCHANNKEKWIWSTAMHVQCQETIVFILFNSRNVLSF